MHWKWLFNKAGLGGWGTQGKAKRRVSYNTRHLFGPLPILNFHNSFNCSDICKQLGAEDSSKKEHVNLRINTIIAVCCSIKMLICFSSTLFH